MALILESLDDLAARVPDGALLAVPPDYAGVAMAATRMYVRARSTCSKYSYGVRRMVSLIGTLGQVPSVSGPMIRRRALIVSGLATLVVPLGTLAAEELGKPSGSVTIEQVQVAFVGSGNLGGGELKFRGRTYP
ncbi:MAG: hypothetical protein ACREQB_04610, partial [Candidatus Binataceae bacterium]